MENVIKNVRLLSFVEDDVLKRLEHGALQHRKFSRITFKVLEAKESEKELKIETRQDKNPNGNHFDSKILADRTKELFTHFLPGWKVNVVAVVHKESPAEAVTPEYIRHEMTELKIKAKDIAADFGIEKTNVSGWMTGAKPMTRMVKAMFYYYFEAKKLSSGLWSANYLMPGSITIGLHNKSTRGDIQQSRWLYPDTGTGAGNTQDSSDTKEKVKATKKDEVHK